MNTCLICQNSINHYKYKTICEGCVLLLSHAQFSCNRCGVTLQQDHTEGMVCGSCQIHPPVFSSVDYVTVYQEPINHWVMALKFGQNTLVSRLFAELMLEKLTGVDADYELMPVPLHKNRLRKRGYNQAYEIAKELANLSGRALNTSLKRLRDTAMQAELKLKERAKNVRKAFAVTSNLKAKKIILIDDVMTSGNTLKECANILNKNKVLDVKILVFSRKSLN